MSYAFGDTDLSGVSNSSILGVGVHDVKITNAVYQPPVPGQPPALELELTSSTGSIKDQLRIHSDSEVGKRISRQRLKQYLVATGHHDPDHPDDVMWFVGKQAKVRIENGKTFTREDGSTGAYKNITGVFAPGTEVPDPVPKQAAPAQPFAPPAASFDDEIPF